MRRAQGFRLVVSLGLIVSGIVVFAASPADAATAAGPYYANPSWDQTLPSDTRFIVLSNMGGNAVLDRETGLVWERSPLAPCLGAICSVPEPGTRNWSEAHEYCNTLSVGNRRGWRLPTIQDLASVEDPSVGSPGPTLPAGHPFTNVQSYYYWSATASATEPSVEWSLNFKNGLLGTAAKSSEMFVWCVRGGQGVDAQ